MAAPILPLFWDLAAVEPQKRTRAAATLVTALRKAQDAFAPTGGGGAAERCADLEYALRRLVRGLASPRDGARQGFGAALIELLVNFSAQATSPPRATRRGGSAQPVPEPGPCAQVSPEAVLDLSDEAMELSGRDRGSEEREVIYGRLFSCAAIVRSRALEKRRP